MISSRSLRMLTVAAVALIGNACSSNTSSNTMPGGSGGSDPGTGGGSGGASTVASGGVVGSGGSAGGSVNLGGSGGNGGAMTGGSMTGGAMTGGSMTIGTGGAMTGGALTGGTGSGGSGSGGRADGGMGRGGAGSGGALTGSGGSGPGSGGAMGTGGTTSSADAGVPAASAGCGKTPTLTSGSRTIQSGSGSRSFMLRIPPNYDNKHPYPLVFGFHWNGGTMGDVDGGGTSGYTWSYYGLREQADNSTNAKMIFVAPQGNGNGWANSGGQDLTLVDDILKQLEGDLCVDTTRIFAMGFSYGGGMSYAIACARAAVFRAVAVYAGAQLSGCTDGTKPIAYIGVHSISDGTCNYSGGESLRTKFVTNNGCTAQTPPKPASSSNTHICTSFEGCRDGYPVRWCAFNGGGHTPAPVDGASDASGGGDKTWTKGEVWKFFTQF